MFWFVLMIEWKAKKTFMDKDDILQKKKKKDDKQHIKDKFRNGWIFSLTTSQKYKELLIKGIPKRKRFFWRGSFHQARDAGGEQ